MHLTCENSISVHIHRGQLYIHFMCVYTVRLAAYSSGMYSISVHIHIHVQYSAWALYIPVPNKTKIAEENFHAILATHKLLLPRVFSTHGVML